MNEYFGIKYQFDQNMIHQYIDHLAQTNGKNYICVADGVSLSTVEHSKQLKAIFDQAGMVICDSGWVPMFIRWIYKIQYRQYTGSSLFSDIIHKKKYNMIFLGTKEEILKPLQNNLAKIDSQISDMFFIELPFRKVEDFNYQSIAKKINEISPDIIWISLGMPKQEIFMYNLLPYINKGILIGVGAAFKFHSGLKNLKRAPGWMIRAKLEWLHRIFSEPKKQISRCILIIRTVPKLLIKEYKKKKKYDVR